MKRLGVTLMALLLSSAARAEEYSVWERTQQAPAYGSQPSPAPLSGDEEEVADARYYDGYYDGYSAAQASDVYDDGYDPQAYEEFEDELAPYGSWVDVPSYGNVWLPSTTVVGSDFTPYASGGRFSYTEYGWTWISDFSWGWAPFHYGRWVDLVSYGWCWVPGTNWGPAWVDWRSGGGYVGWAPLPPRGVWVGPPTVRRAGGVVVGPPSGTRPGGVVVGPPPSAKPLKWNFLLEHQLGAPRPSFVASHVVPQLLARTRVVNSPRSIINGGGELRFNGGPALRVASAVSLQSIAPRALPRPTIAPRAGAPISARPWAPSRSITIRHPTNYVAPQQYSPRPIPSAPSYSRPNYVAPQQYSPRPSYLAPRPIQPLRREPVFTVTRSDGQPAGLPSSGRSYVAPQPSWQAPPSHSAPAYAPPPSFTPRWEAPRSFAPAPHVEVPHYQAPAYQPPHVAPPTHLAAPPAAVRPSFGAPHVGAHAAPMFRGR